MSLVKFRCLDGSNDISAASFEDGSIIFDITSAQTVWLLPKTHDKLHRLSDGIG